MAYTTVKTDWGPADSLSYDELNRIEANIAGVKAMAEGSVQEADIINTASETEAGKVLDARMGKTLNDAIALKADLTALGTQFTITRVGSTLTFVSK